MVGRISKWIVTVMLVLTLIFNFSLSVYAQDIIIETDNTTQNNDVMVGQQRYIIKMKNKEATEDFAEKNKDILEVGKEVMELQNLDSVLLDLSSQELNDIQSNPDVMYVEADASVSIQDIEDQNTTANDLFSRQITSWGTHSIGADLSTENGFAGHGVKIAILDTGIANHSDLNISGGYSFVDDTPVYSDDNGHGTHVAGIIAAKDNGIGIQGIASDSEIYAVKVLDSDGKGNYSQVIQGIDYAIQNQMDVILMSFGGNKFSQALLDAVTAARNNGIVLVAAAGNKGGGEESMTYPALFQEVISTGAVNKSFARANFSSTGQQLDVVAPGTDILSTYMGDGYRSLSGTSMAAPFVAGSLAVIWSKHPDWNDQQVLDALYNSATQLGDAREYGHGLINIAKAAGISDEPIQPFDNGDEQPLPTPGDGSIGEDVSGSEIISGNNQKIMAGSSVTVSAILSAPKPTLTIGVFNPSGVKIAGTALYNQKANVTIPYKWTTNLNEKPGTYTIKFYYDSSTNPSYFYVYVSPNVNKPVSITKSKILADSITITWPAVAGVSKYNVKINSSVSTSTTNSYTFTNLIPATTYSIGVASVNSADLATEYTTTSGTTLNSAQVKPTSPMGLTVTDLGGGQVRFKWDSVVNATNYKIYNNGSLISQTQTNSYTYSGLISDQTYKFGVIASNTIGDSPLALKEHTLVDSFITSTTLQINTEYLSSISYSGDEDYYKFIPSISGLYSIQSTGSADMKGELYDDTADTIINDNDDINSSNLNFLISENLTAGKTYYVMVSSNLESTNNYGIIVKPFIDDYGSDISSSFAFSNSVSGKIEYAGDEDWFRFTPSVSGQYRFETTGATDTWGALYDSSENELSSNDDIATGINNNFKITYHLQASRSYFIRVKHYSNQLTGNYNLSVSSLLDTQSPSIPNKISGYSDSINTIFLGWEPSSDNNWVIGYKLFRNSQEIADIPYTNYQDSGLSPSTTYTYTIKSYDQSGNLSGASNPVNFRTSSLPDTTPPTSPSNVIVTGRTAKTISLSWNTSSDNVGISGYKIYSGSTLLGTTSSTSFTVTALQPGITYQFNVYAIDIAGNASLPSNSVVATTNLTGDNITPSIPTSLMIIAKTSTSTTISWAASLDNVGVVGYDIYSGNSLIGTSIGTSYQINGLYPSTTYSISIKARDASGNTSNASTALYITTEATPDTQAPTIPSALTVVSKSDVMVKLAWNASMDNVGVVSYDIYQGSTWIASSSNTSYSVMNLTPSTSYSFSVKAKDASGNVSALSTTVNTATSATPDVLEPTAPVGLMVSAKSETSVSINWSASNDNVGVVGYNIYRGTILIGSSITTSYKDEGLVASTSYTYTIKAKDAAGNISTASAPLNVTTIAPPDVQAPAIPRNLVVSEVSESTISLSWDPSFDNVGVTGYEIYIGFTLLATSAETTYIVTGLKPNTSYTFNIKAKDLAGNKSSASSTISAKTSPDIQAPTSPSGFKVDLLSETGASLSWLASTDNVGVAGYNIYNGSSLLGTIAETAYIVRGLKPNQEYKFNIQAKDFSGNLSSLVTIDVKTLADVVAPSSPILTAVKTPSTVSLYWSPSTDNVGVIRYDIYQGSVFLGSTTDTKYEVSELTPNTAYTFIVKAVDAGGNNSQGGNLTITTDIDLQAPTVPSDLKITARTASSISLSWGESIDNVGVVGYEVLKDGVLIGSTETTNYTVTGTLSNTIYSFVVKAKDNQNNMSLPSNLVQSIFVVPNRAHIISSANHSVHIKADGTIWSWGNNNYGQLGEGTTSSRSTAVQVPNESSFSSVSAGEGHTIALKSDGTVWVWGNNANGQLGIGNNLGVKTPVQLTLLNNIVAVAAGSNSSYALGNDGSLWAWGSNSYGQLGDGTTNTRLNPIKVNIEGVSAISTSALGSTAYALKSDGTVWAWGKNSSGQIGNGTLIQSNLPVKMNDLFSVVDIVAGANHIVALKTDGTVWTSGDSGGAITSSPRQISQLSGIVSIAAGNKTSYAVKADGNVWSWGLNVNGQLGDGTLTDRLSPVQVTELSKIEYVSGGNNFASAIKADGTIWTWGLNTNGQLGDGTIIRRLTPVQAKDNSSPTVTLVYPAGNQATPATVYINKPRITWNQVDAALTLFMQYQVQVLDANGAVLVDSGVQTQNGTGATGNWTVSSALPANQVLQVRVRVKDETAWSEWSPARWLQVSSSFTGKNLSTSDHTVYVKEDGTVWTWGLNNQGQLGDGTQTNKSTAVQVNNLSSFTSAAAGGKHTIALKADGTVWTWGDNDFGQLGISSQIDSLIPVQVTGLSSVVAVAANSMASYALKNDGTVWAFGYNGSSQLGQSAESLIYAPKKITTLSGITAIAANANTAYALKSDGTVWVWGANGGLFGDGTTSSGHYTPKQANLAGVTAISAGTTHVVALKVDGTIWTWGNSGAGNTTTPVQVSQLGGIVSISAGNMASYAIKSDGSIWSWGLNASGQLGDGTVTTRTTPVQVITLSGILIAAGGNNYASAIKSDGTVWTWGTNNYGQLGDGTTTQRPTPVQTKRNQAPVVTLISPLGTKAAPVIMKTSTPSISWSQEDADSTLFTQYQVQVLDASGVVIIDSGVQVQNGAGSNGNWTVNSSLPANQVLQVRVKVKDETAWSEWSAAGWFKAEVTLTSNKISTNNHTMYVKNDGTVWAWGNNSKGQLGIGTTTNTSTAVQVPGLSSIVSVATGFAHTVALKSDGTVWTWGWNYSGELGNGNNTDSSSPIQVPSLTGIIAIASGSFSSFALKSDGSVWSWGNNESGQLGDGTTTYRSVPTRVNGLSGVKAIAAKNANDIANNAVYALKTDGTVWSWGHNYRGQLGDGTTIDRFVPALISGLTGITQITAGTTHTLALKTDGSVWVWGSSYAAKNQTPAQVSGLSNIVSIAAGNSNSYVLKADGTIWSWGYNPNGQLGDGTITSTKVPVQVIGISGATVVTGGLGNTAALKEDGTVWMWGNNNFGQLGDGTTTERLSPVQVLIPILGK